MTTKKTPKRQARRKEHGTRIEHIVAEDIQKFSKRYHNISINTREGIDVFLRNGIRLDVEVKSANAKTLYKDKHGNYKFRTGRFLIKMYDYINADLFAFVIKEVDQKGKWTGNVDINYVKAETIRRYLKDRNLYKKRKDVKIGINTINNLQKTYLKTYLK